MSKYQRLEYWRDRYAHLKRQREQAKPTDPVALLTDVEAAYIAGLVDGEGSFTISRNVRGVHIPAIDIIMTFRPVIEWFASRLGVTVRSRTPRSARYRMQYHVRVAGKRAVNLCVILLPFLRVKKDQANLMIRFGDTYNPHEGWERKITPEVHEKREQIRLEIMRLNRS